MKKSLLAMLAAGAMGFACAYADSPEITMTFNPENESVLTELSSFEITYNVPMSEDWPDAVRVLRDGRELEGVSVSIDIAANKKSVTYTLSQTQTEEGTYSFRNLAWSVMPATPGSGDTPDFDLTYYIGEPKELEPYLITSPRVGQTVTSLSEILLIFENVKTIEINNEKSVVLTNGADTYDYCLSPVEGYMQVLAAPVEEGLSINQGGTYQLVIEEGALILNGREYGYSLEYKVSEPLRIVSIDPAEGETTAEALENITLTFNKEITGLTGYMMAGLQLRLCNDELDPLSVVADYNATIDSSNHYVVHLNAIDGVDAYEAGYYTLNLPPTLFVAGSEKNLAQLIVYTIGKTEGISTVSYERNGMNVYTVGGVKVIENGSRDAVRALSPGIYIINGKTTIIK